MSFFAGAFECDAPRLGDVKGRARGGRVATLGRPLARSLVLLFCGSHASLSLSVLLEDEFDPRLG